MDLEYKRKEDDAWCECEVFIRAVGARENVLMVQFSGTEVDTIVTVDEAKARIRALSKPLEVSQCSELKEGDDVLAARMHKSGKCHFYEAQIIKIKRHSHASHGPCKCNFHIMWMDKSLRGERADIVASQIRVIVRENIQDKAVLSQWIKCLNTDTGQQLETSDIESDYQKQLEEEIDKITVLACSIDKVDTLEDVTSTPGNQRDGNCSLQRGKAKIKIESVACVTRATRARLCKQAQSDCTTDPSLSPSLLTKRPRLSPLAARAALAAAIQEAPHESMQTVARSGNLLAGKVDSQIVETCSVYKKISKPGDRRKRGGTVVRTCRWRNEDQNLEESEHDSVSHDDTGQERSKTVTKDSRGRVRKINGKFLDIKEERGLSQDLQLQDKEHTRVDPDGGFKTRQRQSSGLCVLLGMPSSIHELPHHYEQNPPAVEDGLKGFSQDAPGLQLSKSLRRSSRLMMKS